MAAGRPLLSLLQTRYPQEGKDQLFARILCGEVLVEGERVKDPKRRVPADAELQLESRRFVSRGGEKLEAALDAWSISVEGRVFVDAGASTGGFTDCLLARGAAYVHAVDVGFNQLAYRLRSDARVNVLESTNITHVRHLDPPADAAVCDLSFRSLSGVAEKLLSLSRESWFIALVKPQFELRNAGESFDGVVRDKAEAHAVLAEVLERLRSEGSPPQRLMASPIRGRRGNHEYLVLCGGEPGPAIGELLEGISERW
ncbi:MAG: TlyA family RNA methyltransferase [Spirochaetota bacterium]